VHVCRDDLKTFTRDRDEMRNVERFIGDETETCYSATVDQTEILYIRRRWSRLS